MASFLHSLYRKVRYGEPVIVVSGLPRSGTSMAMKMLDVGGLGLVIDGVREADVDNPKGYYEYERVKDLETETDKSYLRQARGKAIKVISFLLPHLPADLNYKVVFMVRPLEEVLASQTKMLDHRSEEHDADDGTMHTIYEGHLWRTRYLLEHQPRFETLEVPYRQALDDPQTHAERIAEFLGRDLDVEAMTGVVDKSLYRNRAEKLAASADGAAAAAAHRP